MRVLVVSHLALPHIGGVEVLVDRESRALAAAGHRVVLVTSNGGDGAMPEYPPAVRIVRVPAWHVLERRYRIPYPLFGPRLLAVLWREVGQCDVVHAHGFLFMNSVLSLLVGWLRHKPRILTDHGGIQQFHSRLATLLARLSAVIVGRLSARLATRLVSYNARVARLLERLAGTQTKTLFLPNPVDRTLFRPPTDFERQAARTRLGWPPDRPKALFVGRLIPEKGIPLLLKAIDARYDLVFCGPGDVAQLGPLPRPGVEYLPPRPQADLVPLYHAADLFVLPAGVREGFPLVVQEALACGLRVILGYDEGFEPYRQLPGLSFCERTPEAVRAAIVRALESPDPAAREGTSAPLDELCPPADVWVRRLYADLEPQA